MNEKIIKPGVIQRITNRIKDKNPLYTPKAADDVLTAFFNVITDAIANGDSIVLNGYMTVKPQFRAKSISSNGITGEKIIIPEHYTAKLKAGAKLKEAAKQLTEKQIGEINE